MAAEVFVEEAEASAAAAEEVSEVETQADSTEDIILPRHHITQEVFTDLISVEDGITDRISAADGTEDLTTQEGVASVV